MKKILLILAIVIGLVSCGTNETVLSTGVNLREYKYCVLRSGNIIVEADVTDIVLKVENVLPHFFTIVSKNEAENLILDGKKVLTSSINAKSEKWGGHSMYISISFHDYKNGRLLAVSKSSGHGNPTVEIDKENALAILEQELMKVFKK